MLGNKYRVTHDGQSLLAAGWIGVVPVAARGVAEKRGGLVPKSYIQLPDSYKEGSVSAAAAAAAAAAALAAAEGDAAATVEDDTTSEYETETETEEEDDTATETEDEAEEVNEEDLQASGEEEDAQSESSSQRYESEYETTESEEEAEGDGNGLNATTSSLHGVEKDDELDTIREIMMHIYQQHNPRKINDVDRLLGEWQGEERLLLAKIRAKYD
eukprot:COSAG02_NODE_3145_length_7289_cov_10.121280_2_plen_215_part_00